MQERFTTIYTCLIKHLLHDYINHNLTTSAALLWFTGLLLTASAACCLDADCPEVKGTLTSRGDKTNNQQQGVNKRRDELGFTGEGKCDATNIS